ncbi:uncharacterized protein N7483_005988 [Penicillium malachiteum]|uniref:uncharacterized protein n=1 Tax=Penicillium malachiteum TaxID=1324776 RepID=UPI002548987C|nr:uncharacterized protein N7483_005988 [Penicillium malachiteum]KAJ5731480.1 hypothetical protein N7483_005988 [Penicillium malachiteum]
MERPSKRPRLSPELDHTEKGVLEEQDEEIEEEWDLQAARAHNDMRLKSIFEGIFSKYGKDFTDIADEIDLQTGKIVVDNGHLSGMRQEDDAGEASEAWLHEAALSDGETDDDREGTGLPEKLPEISVEGETELVKSPLNNALVDTGLDSKMTIKKPVINLANVPDPFYQDTGPVDPAWQAPALPTQFTTPSAETRYKNVSPRLPGFRRDPSPPGSGSLWSINQPARRPRTEGKPRATPSKRRPRAKRKYHSSPMVHDWSFAATPDGDESDDPLQEFEPSPSAKRGKTQNLRGKYMQPPDYTDSPLSRQPLPDTLVPRDDDQSANEAEVNLDESHTSGNDTQNHVAFDETPNLQQCDSYATPHSHVADTTSSDNTPTKSPRGLEPDEAKLIVRMRHMQKKNGRKFMIVYLAVQGLVFINGIYIIGPPVESVHHHYRLPGANETGLSWLDITDKFPHRTKAEIEFELLRLWVGDEVWLGEGYRAPEQSIQQDEEYDDEQSDVPEEIAAPDEGPSPESPGDDDSFIFARKKPQEPQEPIRVFEDLVDESDEEDDDPLASSPSKLSAIYIDSPSVSRQGSRTPRKSPAKRFSFII